MTDIPQGYKQTEVGVIPADWSLAPLGRLISSVEYGSSAKSRAQGRIPVLRMGNLQGGKIDWNDLVYTNDESEIRKYMLHSGDVLFNRTNTVDLVGKTSIYKGEHPAIFAGYLIRINVQETLLNSKFLNYVLNAEFSKNHSSKVLSVAVGQANINGQKLKAYPIPLPPTKAEQEAIAEALSDADALIESLEQLIAKKRQIKQGAMQELLTGKRRLPGFSGEWEVKSFGEVFDYFPTATNSRNDLGDEGDTYYIHYGDIHTRFHRHLDFKTVQPPRIERSHCRNAAQLKNGDWVMADASEDFNGVGKSVEVFGLEEGTAAVAGLHTFLLREKKPSFAPGFKGHLGDLKSLHDQFLRVATGMKVFGVSKAALRDLLLSVPPLPEQTAIATILSDMDAEITELEEKLAKARKLKQGMMQELLTGRIRLV